MKDQIVLITYRKLNKMKLFALMDLGVKEGMQSTVLEHFGLQILGNL